MNSFHLNIFYFYRKFFEIMFQQQMSQRGHLSKSCRRGVFPPIKDDNTSTSPSPTDYTDPLYLTETYSKLVSQIRNIKKEIDPLLILFQRLQGELDPNFLDTSSNIEITRKISSLQAQQYDFDEKVANMRRQYSFETKERLDMELNHYRVVLNESRFDLNKTNKMIKRAKTELQAIKKQNSIQKYINCQNKIKEMNNRLNDLRQTEKDLNQKMQDINSANKPHFSEEVEYLINTLRILKEKSEVKKSKLCKIKVTFENKKKILIAQIESKNKQQVSFKQEKNFNTSLRRIVVPPPSSRKTKTENKPKVQNLPGIRNTNHSYNINSNYNSGINDSKLNTINRSKTPRRNELEQHQIHRSNHKLSMSVSTVQQSATPSALPPPKPSRKPNPRSQKISFRIADPSVKILKMQKNNDEFNDFISFS